MANETVTLSSNGNYWQAFYYDSMGRRRAKSLGTKKSLSKRKAKVLCDRLAADMKLNPAIANIEQPLRLGEFIDRYFEERTDIRSATINLHRLTVKYLKKFFGEEIRIDRITRAMASDWRSAVVKGKIPLTKTKKKKAMSEATICIHVRNARTIFNHALRDDLLLFNPFDRLKGTAPEPDKDWKYITIDELDKLLKACPNWGWKMLLALCRLAGLRRGEALELTWGAIDWDEKHFTVIAQKTGRRRIIPIQPKLFKLLLEAFEVAPEGETRICSISRHCLWRNFQKIREQAGLAKWKDAFQVMRRNCETDWAQEYPQYAVSNWIGHDIKVSARHYLQVPKELYAKMATETESDSTSETDQKLPNPAKA